MDSTVRCYGKRSDAEAAEQVARDLEAMGYNLDCESFITKDSSTNASKVERYASKHTNVKVNPSRTPSRYNFGNVESNESSDDVEAETPPLEGLSSIPEETSREPALDPLDVTDTTGEEEPLEEDRSCPICDHVKRPLARYCTQCGEKL